MLILIFISAFWLILSIVIHACTLCNIFVPSEKLLTVLNIGIVVLFCILSYVWERLGQGIDKKEFREDIRNAAPHWVTIIAAPLLMYGIFVFIFFLGMVFSTVSDNTNNIETTNVQFSKGLTALSVAFCSICFLKLYSLRSFKKRGMNDN